MTDSSTNAGARADVLLLHASRFGQSAKIADALAAHLCEQGLAGHVLALRQCDAGLDLSAYRAVVLVASIRYGHFDSAVPAFVRAHAAQLQCTLSAFVSVNLTARKPDKRTPQTNVYTRKFLLASAQQGWRPDVCEVVAGALRYPRYNWLDRCMIQLIMRLTGGETDPSREVEYTDWSQVQKLAERLAQGLKA